MWGQKYALGTNQFLFARPLNWNCAFKQKSLEHSLYILNQRQAVPPEAMSFHEVIVFQNYDYV